MATLYTCSRACRYCEIMFGQNKTTPWGYNQDVTMSATVTKCTACQADCKYTVKYSRANTYVCVACFQRAQDGHAVTVTCKFPVPDQAELYYAGQQGVCSTEYTALATRKNVAAWRSNIMRRMRQTTTCVVCARVK